MKKLKILLSLSALILILFLVSCAIIPAFQKKSTRTAAVQKTETDFGAEQVMSIDDNEQALLRRLQLIRSAQSDLILATYSFQDDESGRDIMAALYDAAQRGVSVRMLLDGLAVTVGVRSSDAFEALAAHENVQVRIYNPISIRNLWRCNYRMHDKYLIADGGTYILGGRNTRNVSLGNYQPDQDIDRDLLVYHRNDGPDRSVHQVEGYFESNWAQATPFSGEKRPEGDALLQKQYQQLQIPEPDWEKDTIPVKSVTLLTNPNQPFNKEPVLWKQLCSLMEEGTDIMVQTPYIICNRMMYQDLAHLTGQGKKIRLITNSVASGANLFGCADYLNQSGKIRKTGLQVYEYAGEHSSHTKTVLIDQDISIVGSFNFDMRSAYLDTEMMLVVESPELNAHYREMNEGYIERSRWVQPDGTVLAGKAYEEPEMPWLKKALYGIVRVLSYPVRHLL